MTDNLLVWFRYFMRRLLFRSLHHVAFTLDAGPRPRGTRSKRLQVAGLPRNQPARRGWHPPAAGCGALHAGNRQPLAEKLGAVTILPIRQTPKLTTPRQVVEMEGPRKIMGGKHDLAAGIPDMPREARPFGAVFDMA